MILNALVDHAICHRSAGRLLALIADRRAQLERDALKAQMDALQAELLAWNQQLSKLEPSDKYLVSALGPQPVVLEDSTRYSASRQIQR